MAILLTGAAGFIGFHTTLALLKRGETVIGVDNLNNYYDVNLKKARLAQLLAHKNFSFHKMDIADKTAIASLPKTFDRIIHLAAQAGVRYSLKNPQAYIDSNITGHLTMLELARNTDGLKHFVYASSSSVYGGNTKTPFSIKDAVEKPVSLYAATKRAGELMAYNYAHLFRFAATGLRFFTVYGPWGRPDMAAYLFTKNILAGEPIAVFNHGKMQRDFTYIDDIVDGILATLDHPLRTDDVPHRVFNLGNSHPEKLTDFIGIIENALGKKAIYDFQPIQPGDVPSTSADISESKEILGFQPKVTIDEGIPRFVAWYKNYNQL
ncbi:MAG: NAD-dependent epimerase/dehydratase family protein [Alphaproteobacteria bacterium]|nr:NAD-dependent epimerase/dehydratase family protein [Alphaproteobacteria bacterium]